MYSFERNLSCTQASLSQRLRRKPPKGIDRKIFHNTSAIHDNHTISQIHQPVKTMFSNHNGVPLFFPLTYYCSKLAYSGNIQIG